MTQSKYRYMETCSALCAQDLKEDRKVGLIYGPYGEKDADGKLRFMSSFEFAGKSNCCTYCGGQLPSGRAKRILAIIERQKS